MSSTEKVLITEGYLEDIADEIRTKLGVETQYKPSEMAGAIATIQNTYTAEDEGKVVSSGALMVQTAHATVTQNGTYDTTENNSVEVDVAGGGGGSTDVPSGYTRLEYIQSSGGAYINTGISGGVKVHCKAGYTSWYAGYDTLCGAQDAGGSNNNRHGVIIRNSTASNYLAWIGSDAIDTGIPISFSDFLEIDVDTRGSGYGISTDNSVFRSSGGGSARSNFSLFLFAMNDAGTGRYNSNAKIDYLFMWNTSGTLVRQFYAAKRNSDNVLGLWDAVSETFFTNAGGGTFIAGAEVSTMQLISKAIAQNGTYDPADDNADGYSEVVVNVPNSYSASDEGKVVSSGSLVGQTSRNVSQNGTYDTTLNDEIVVSVSGGGGIATLLNKSQYNPTSQGSWITFNESVTIPKQSRYLIVAIAYTNNLIVSVNGVAQTLDFVDSGDFVRYFTKELDLQANDVVNLSFPSSGKSAAYALIADLNGDSGGGSEPEPPSTYVQLEYIEFTPYCSYPVTIPNNAKIVCDFTTGSDINSERCVFGYAESTDDSKDFEAARTYSGGLWYFLRNFSRGYQTGIGDEVTNITANTRYKYVSYFKGLRTTAHIGGYKCTNQRGGWNGKIHSIKLYDYNTDELLLKFVPCRLANDSSTFGFYEAVTETFYTTTTGDGGVIAGGDL